MSHTYMSLDERRAMRMNIKDAMRFDASVIGRDNVLWKRYSVLMENLAENNIRLMVEIEAYRNLLDELHELLQRERRACGSVVASTDS